MSNTSGSDLNLKPIFSKLGHNLEEIRVRALDNIVSKLEHNLVCDADLVQERSLHIKLLEWFNFSSCPAQGKVLSLILRLSKHPSAAALYLDIGGVDFLTQLRPNTSADLHKVIDGILDNLFHLPDTQYEHHTQECIYKQPTHSVYSQHAQELDEALPSEFLKPSDSYLHPGAPSPGPQHPHPSPAEPEIGYFSPHVEEKQQYVAQTIPVAAAKCFKFSTFPLIALTQTDRHVLTSTDSSLRSNDVSLVISACDFLTDVVFQDFPAEVFLQRPNIVKSLLLLLAPPMNDPKGIAVYALKTLKDLISMIESRVYFYQDPSVYTPKQDFSANRSISESSASFLSHSLGSSDSRPSVIGHSEMRHSGDGQDGDNSNSTGSGTPVNYSGSPEEQVDTDDIQSLQFTQWSTTQLCMAIIEKLLPCMKTPDEKFILHSVYLLNQVLDLLRESVDAEVLWEDNSVPARELMEKLNDSFEMISDVIYLHYHGNLSHNTPEPELCQHRVAYIGIAEFTVNLLKVVVPVEKATKALTTDFSQVLSLLANDESMWYCLPAIRQGALSYLHALDDEAHGVFIHAQEMCGSLQSACHFLMEADEMTDENVLELLTFAEQGYNSVAYHSSLQFVDYAVKMASYICKKSTPNPTSMRQVRNLHLRLLSSPISSIRQQAYFTTLSIVKECLGINHVTEPTSTATQGIVFTLHSKVLYQICCFGMADQSESARKMASEIVQYLLQSQLLMPAARWQLLMDTFTPILPVLQGYGSMETAVGKLIIGALSTERKMEPGSLPLVERLRGTLRLMYRHETRLRADSLGRLAWYLAHEEDCMRKLPLFSELDVANLTNMFIIDSPRSIVDEDTSRSVFQPENVDKVYTIFTSQSVEPTVKKSAADQLAIMLQDPVLHAVFLQRGGVESALSILHQGVCKPNEEEQPLVHLLPSVVKMLRCLCQHLHSIRHDLAHRSEVYYSLLRCGIILNRDQLARSDVSELLAMLLFDEVTAVDKTHGGLTLPSFVTKRFSLPFKPHIHDTQSEHHTPLPPDSDPLKTGSLAEMLRLTWNVAWHDGIQEAIRGSGGDENTEKLFSSRLRLTKVDRVILRASHIPSALQDSVYNIENATSHDMVRRGVRRLSSILVACGQQDVSPSLHCLQWRSAIARFLKVIPSSTADEELLYEILQLLAIIIQTPKGAPREVLDWVGEMLHHTKGALLGLLAKSDPQANDGGAGNTLVARRQLNRQLLQVIAIYVGKYPYSVVDRSVFECVRGDLTKSLLSRINRQDAAHFYNLASLESTLLCLTHITARPGWSTGSQEANSLSVCLQVLHSLLEVVSAFHIGRGGVSMSLMGRGVTRSAAITLRHLAHEMAVQLQSQDWPRNWLFSRQATADSVGESGLHWLIPLWSYRDTEVRAAGVGIAVALSSTEAGRITMATQCQHIPGGIWGAAFTILLDQSECSMVRQQAALLLQNLTSQPMPSGSVETAQSMWHGPIVRHEETQVSLVGLSALLALLHHTNFYTEMTVLLSNYYPQPAIHPVSVTTKSPFTTPIGSHSTLTTTGTGASRHLSHLSINSSSTQQSSTADDNGSFLIRPSTVGHNGGNILQSASNVSRGTQGGSNSNTPGIMSQPRGTSTPTSAATTSSDGSTPEYQSVATPCMVSSVCALFDNLLVLAADDTLSCIKKDNLHSILISMLDYHLLDSYIKELSTSRYRAQYLVTFQELVTLYGDVLHTLEMCVRRDNDIKQHLAADKSALKHIVRLLSVSWQDDKDTSTRVLKMWLKAFTLLASLFQADGPQALVECSDIFVKLWSILAARITSVLQEEPLNSDLWFSALYFLSGCLNEEGKRIMGNEDDGVIKYKLADALDVPLQQENDGDIFNSTSGSLVCQSLIKVFDKVCMKSAEQVYPAKVAVVNALKSLLGVSNTAKTTALEAGLMESVCEHIKHLHHRLSLDVLSLEKIHPSKKKDNPIILELILMLELLRNFMNNNHEIKVSAYECNLGSLVHKLWAWCQMEAPLMSTTLALLATFTARCPQASSSLAFTSSVSSADDKILKQQHSSNSLVHALIKLIQKESGTGRGDINVLKVAFAVMTTLTYCQECRGIMWKSNFVHGFSELSPKRTKKTKAQRCVETLWLSLLASLSFSTEGQNMILKIDESLPLLLEFGTVSNDSNRTSAVLVLRNLCFHSSNKPRLLSNEKIVPFFLQCLEEGNDVIKMYASSAVYALVYNSQKTKATFKNTNITRRLQEAHNYFINAPEVDSYQKCAKNIQQVLALLKN